MQIGTVVTRRRYLFSMHLQRQKGTPLTHTFPPFALAWDWSEAAIKDISGTKDVGA